MFIDSLAYFTILYDLLHLLNNQCRYCTIKIVVIHLHHQIITNKKQQYENFKNLQKRSNFYNYSFNRFNFISCSN